MSATTRRRGPHPFPEILAGVLTAAALGILLLGYVARRGGTLAAVLSAAALGAAGVLVVTAVRLRARRPAIDRTARLLAGPADLPGMTTSGAAATAARLGVRAHDPGVFIGRSVRRDRELWGSWEDMHMDIWGPRTGKTAARAIPAAAAAPGALVVTSNKRDIVDATRGIREKRGPVWVFDPQGQAGEQPTWWWNPLSFVGDNVVKGLMLASFFNGINRQSHVRADGYFEPAGQQLFGALLLAASLDEQPVTRTLTWLNRPTDDTPVRILRAAGADRVADAAEMIIAAPASQRAGVYGAASQMASPLAAPDVTRWVTPGSGPRRPEFRHADFGDRDDGTIYLLSEETNRAAAPLILTLTSALAYSLEGRAIASPGGRLPVPAVFVLDEAANVCPWHELPFLYSHYGSRGIVMMTILQSWAQGVTIWGEHGMASMWSAANVRVYGGGSADARFLHDLAQAAPRFEPRTKSVSSRVGMPFAGSTTRSSREEQVLDIADLGAMPRGRALVQVSGARPTLVRTVPWWQGPYAEEIRESLAAYAPGPGTRADTGQRDAGRRTA
ncbi:type IV secretory system conjugative DNA transfer family protein [Streptodolium elevatio]|uniref:TraM recognition domain-containing protein n=1 Tax=Streptodolium elevatio TaxID=3157996 RepID=A0ABV3DD74_9ACTN